MTIPMQLCIVKGIPRVPEDTASFEPAQSILNLMSVSGFSVGDNGWIPQMAQVKTGAVYADSPLMNGRIPLALPLGAVTETIKLTSTASSWEARYWLETQLAKFAQDARDYWTTNWQIHPVYLMWKAPFAPGEQYAPIFNIDIARNRDAFYPGNVNELTITIDRGEYWQPIPIGDNPKKYSYIKRSEPLNFKLSTASLISSSGHLVSGSIKNRFLWNTAHDPYRAASAVNYIDIAASDVQGDLPALAQITIEPNRPASAPQPYTEIYIWRSSRNLSVTDRNGLQYANAYNLNADTDKSGTAQLSTVLAGSASGSIVWSSYALGLNNHLWLDKNLLRGRFIAFARMYTTTGNNGDVRAQLQIVDQGSSTANTSVTGAEVRVGITNALHYLGVFNIPFQERAQQSLKGYGMEITPALSGGPTTPYNIAFNLLVRNTVGTSRTLNMWDLVLMPIDEDACIVRAASYSSGGESNYIVLDGTGHLSRGWPEPSASMVVGSSAFGGGGRVPSDYGGEAVELRGHIPMLLPNTAQRLYFMFNLPSTQVPFNAPSLVDGFNIYLNVLPRYLGVRSA